MKKQTQKTHENPKFALFYTFFNKLLGAQKVGNFNEKHRNHRNDQKHAKNTTFDLFFNILF